MFKTVVFDKRESVAYVTLNRPDKLNAYNVQMRDDLHEVFGIVRDDPDIRAMVIHGAGKAFCAGADLTEFGTAPSPVIARGVRWGRDLWGILKDVDKITVAAMHGYVFGSGFEMALLCDFRLAAEGTVFGLPETGLGFIPGAGATQALPRVIKPGAALVSILTGERIDSAEAYRLGLLHRVVPRESLLAQAEAFARRILSAGPLATTIAKEAINKGLDLSLENGLRLEERLSDLLFDSSDAWEGLRAHVHERNPLYRGK